MIKVENRSQCTVGYMGYYGVDPAILFCLVLLELMPTRIRSNGMSIALLINQAALATFAAIFLAEVEGYGYSITFIIWAGCSVIYFLAAFFLLPEPKSKTFEKVDVLQINHLWSTRGTMIGE